MKDLEDSNAHLVCSVAVNHAFRHSSGPCTCSLTSHSHFSHLTKHSFHPISHQPCPTPHINPSYLTKRSSYLIPSLNIPPAMPHTSYQALIPQQTFLTSFHPSLTFHTVVLCVIGSMPSKHLVYGRVPVQQGFAACEMFVFCQ